MNAVVAKRPRRRKSYFRRLMGAEKKPVTWVAIRALGLSPNILLEFAICDSPEALTDDAFFLNDILNEERQLLTCLL